MGWLAKGLRLSNTHLATALPTFCLYFRDHLEGFKRLGVVGKCQCALRRL